MLDAKYFKNSTELVNTQKCFDSLNHPAAEEAWDLLVDICHIFQDMECILSEKFRKSFTAESIEEDRKALYKQAEAFAPWVVEELRAIEEGKV